MTFHPSFFLGFDRPWHLECPATLPEWSMPWWTAHAYRRHMNSVRIRRSRRVNCWLFNIFYAIMCCRTVRIQRWIPSERCCFRCAMAAALSIRWKGLRQSCRIGPSHYSLVCFAVRLPDLVRAHVKRRLIDNIHQLSPGNSYDFLVTLCLFNGPWNGRCSF